MAEKTPEEIRAQIELVKQLKVEQLEFNKLKSEELKAIRAITAASQENIEKSEAALEVARKRKVITEAGQKDKDKEVTRLKEDIALRKKRLAIIKETENTDKKVQALQNKANALLKKRSEFAANEYKTKKQLLAVEGNLEKATKKRNAGLKESNNVLLKAADAAGDLGEMLVDIGAQAPTMALGKLLGYDINVKAIGTAMAGMTKQVDESLSGMVKKTGLNLQELQTQAVSAVDPQYAIDSNETLRKQLNALGEEGKVAFTEMGLTIQESSAATLELINNAAAFRIGAGEADQAATLLTTNLVAGLSKVGVKQSQSVKMINLYTKAMKKSPIEANKAIKKLVGVSKAMGVSLDTAFSNFDKAAPVLSQFGDRMGEVFADMQARAAATGTELNTLVGAAMKMDTFKGAAEAAQGLNAILGGMYISTTELVNADPAEKMAIIADGIKKSGKEVGDLDRKLQAQMATYAGLSSVAELNKQVYNTDAIEAASAATDANAASNDDLTKMVGESQTALEKQKASLSATVGGMTEALPKLRSAAEDMSRSVSAGFKATKESTGSALAAVTGMKVALKEAGGDMDKLIDKFVKVTTSAAKFGVFGGAAAAVIKKAVEGGETQKAAGLPLDKVSSAGEVQEAATPARPQTAAASPVTVNTPTPTSVTLLDPNNVMISYEGAMEAAGEKFTQIAQESTEYA